MPGPYPPDGTPPQPAVGHKQRPRLTAALTHLRTPRPKTTHRDHGDSTIIDLVADPFTTVDDAHDTLTALRETFEHRDDGRAVFLTIYEPVTDTVATEIDRNAFGDPDWVADYLVVFANYYRRALHAYETGEFNAVPDPWQLAFDAATADDTLTLQDAFLGINAHINYDLALTLSDVGIDPDRSVRYADHRAVTDILRTLVDDTQTTLVEEFAPGIDTLDAAFGTLDEHLSIFTIDQCRESAWRNAVAMHSRFGIRQRFAKWVTDATATGIAHLILSSKASVTVQSTLNEFERRTP